MPGNDHEDAGMGHEGSLRSLLAAIASAGAVLLLAAVPGPAIHPGGPGQETALLAVHAWPWARVRIDGGPWLLTPLPAPVPVAPGQHRLVAEHPALGRVERTVAATAGARLEIALTLPVRDVDDADDPVPSTPAGAESPGSPGPRAPRPSRARDVPPPRGPGALPGTPLPANLPLRQLLARRRAGRAAACARLARLVLARDDLPKPVRKAAARHGAWALLALGRRDEAAELVTQAGLSPDPMVDPPELVTLWPARP